MPKLSKDSIEQALQDPHFHDFEIDECDPSYSHFLLRSYTDHSLKRDHFLKKKKNENKIQIERIKELAGIVKLEKKVLPQSTVPKYILDTAKKNQTLLDSIQAENHLLYLTASSQELKNLALLLKKMFAQQQKIILKNLDDLTTNILLDILTEISEEEAQKQIVIYSEYKDLTRVVKLRTEGLAEKKIVLIYAKNYAEYASHHDPLQTNRLLEQKKNSLFALLKEREECEKFIIAHPPALRKTPSDDFHHAKERLKSLIASQSAIQSEISLAQSHLKELIASKTECGSVIHDSALHSSSSTLSHYSDRTHSPTLFSPTGKSNIADKTKPFNNAAYSTHSLLV